jgi:Ca2+-binding EF-hand superfamily protein
LEVTEEVIGRIQRIFDRFDDDFKGKVKLPAFIEALKVNVVCHEFCPQMLFFCK